MATRRTKQAFSSSSTSATTSTTATPSSKVDEYNELMANMSRQKEQWDAQDKDDNDNSDDEQDQLLSNAIDLAIQQGRGWGPGEKEAYLEKILDDDFIPPMFATSLEQVQNSGLQEAFTSLIYDGESPTRLMLQFRQKGNEAFQNGQRSAVQNKQYYRDAINHYYEALAWALKIEPLRAGDYAVADTDDPTYTQEELNAERATICANIALAHLRLKNWGHVRDESKKALQYNERNCKAWYRLAKAYQNLKEWELAGDAVERGLGVDPNNKDLLQLQKLLAEKVRKARLQRQQRERARAERVARVKAVWKHCSGNQIQLGRVPLVTSVSEDDDNDVEDESRWHQHLPHSGKLPSPAASGVAGHDEWTWPCMFLYPSHNQSDFIPTFGEDEMIAWRLAQVFPELEDNGGATSLPWDDKNEFVCSQLALYFEVHTARATDNSDCLVHPDNVELLRDQASTMRFYEAARALKGDEGPDMANVARAAARKHLYRQQKAWKKKHGSLWAKPDPYPVVRVHPAMTLRDVLRDNRMVVPNFLVTFIVFPENHPSHASYLKEHKCMGVLQPDQSATGMRSTDSNDR